jgi:hypothetical protein
MTMLEKVAISIGDVVWRQYGIIPGDEDMDRLARAALLSLKEVDEPTIEAMAADHIPLEPRAAFQAAIDHILTGGAE